MDKSAFWKGKHECKKAWEKKNEEGLEKNKYNIPVCAQGSSEGPTATL